MFILPQGEKAKPFFFINNYLKEVSLKPDSFPPLVDFIF